MGPSNNVIMDARQVFSGSLIQVDGVKARVVASLDASTFLVERAGKVEPWRLTGTFDVIQVPNLTVPRVTGKAGAQDYTTTLLFAEAGEEDILAVQANDWKVWAAEINKAEAMSWLKIHRRGLWAEMACIDLAVVLFESGQEWRWRDGAGNESQNGFVTRREAAMDAVERFTQ